jgi:glycosyltransferase involved in cell wall biosynthesis
MQPHEPLRLALFFTRNVSLRTWQEGGMLERELALYRRLRDSGVETTLITYGGAGDPALAGRTPGLEVLCNERGLPAPLYERLLPLLHARALRRCQLFKTNQTDGARAALRAARLWRRPLLARSGYLWSANAERESGRDSRRARRARRLERRAFRAARLVSVTTEAMRAEACARTGVAPGRVRVVPNYVDTDLFRPPAAPRPEGELVFVGRLSAEKNLPALFEAIAPLAAARLTVIGAGDERAGLERRFPALAARVRWLGSVPNPELPAHLGRASLFVLPSRYEGHPKALLEAMACGLAVLGADAPGIRELLRHGETGWLCKPDPASLRAAIEELLARPELREALGHAARRRAVEVFSLDRVARLEGALLREAASRPAPS